MKLFDVTIGTILAVLIISGLTSSYRTVPDIYPLTAALSLLASPSTQNTESYFMRPEQKAKTTPPDITASAYVSIYASPDGREFILGERDMNDKHLIASITKLMSGLVAFDRFNKNTQIVVDKKWLPKQGSSGVFRGKEHLSVDTLLNMLLIESNNDTAEILASAYGRADFIRQMNEKTRELGLSQTWFENPTGLDFAENTPQNYSSARDIARFLAILYTTRPELFDILRTSAYAVRDASDRKLHVAHTTNKLLEDSTLPLRVFGGKTGETPHAKQNLAIVAASPNKKGFLVLVVLHSNNHFEDMKKLIEWSNAAFEWQ